MGQSIEGVDKRAGWPEAPKLINPTSENFNKLEVEQYERRIKELEETERRLKSMLKTSLDSSRTNEQVLCEGITQLQTENKQLLSLLREIYNNEYINNNDLNRRLAEVTK